jgi:hypothetical protein
MGAQSPNIHVDQFGYYPNAEKVAVISNPILGYNNDESYTPGNILEVKEVGSNNVIFSGTAIIWKNGQLHDQSGDEGWWFDFSAINIPGSYYIFDPANNTSSAVFDINENVYDEILKAAGRMFYYNRCNTEKDAAHAGTNWADGTSFLNNLQDGNARFIFDPSNAALEKDLSGGWFDAGDYNKYTTFANNTIHNLLWAYRENPMIFGDDWNIPESGNGIPDLLDEIKWELDWLLKMNNPDGSTINKIGSRNYSENTASPPSLNTDQRYYGNECSSASIAVAGMFAHAATVYKNFPGMLDFANTLESAAIQSWSFVLPSLDANNLELDCDDGSIISGDADWDFDLQKDKAVGAAAYLFELTGDISYNLYLITNAQNDARVFANNFWGPYETDVNDALLMYTNLNNADVNLVNAITTSFSTVVKNNYNGFYGFNDADLYRAFMPDWSYHWGSSLPKANYGTLNYMIERYQIDPANDQDYKNKRYNQLHYFHGVNPLGLVQLSNMESYGAERSCSEIYHTWFNDGTDYDNAQTSLYGPAPGFVTGGANANFTVGSLSPPSGQPLQKSYLDFNDGWPNNSWEISEPAIYYQAAYLRLIASIVGEGNVDTISGGCTTAMIDSSNFENGFQFWNDGGRNCKRVKRQANSGAYSVMIRGRSNSSQTLTNELDLSAYENITLDFSYIVESFDNVSEDFWLQISEDGGTWVTIEEWNLGDEFENLERKFDSVTIEGPFSSKTRIKFRCHASGSKDWVFLDDIKISGCSNTTLPLSVSQKNENLNLNLQTNSESKLNLYPNPTDDVINLDFSLDKNETIEISIMDLTGQVILIQERSLFAGNQKLQISVDDFISGFYIIQLKHGQNLQNKKFYKK